MKELGVWEPLMVKTQTFKTAIEAGEAVTAVGSEARSACGGGGGGVSWTWRLLGVWEPLTVKIQTFGTAIAAVELGSWLYVFMRM
jgi:hypothetical protein